MNLKALINIKQLLQVDRDIELISGEDMKYLPSISTKVLFPAAIDPSKKKNVDIVNVKI